MTYPALGSMMPGFAPGDRLGMSGFGGSAHPSTQLASAMGAEVHVVTRGEAAREPGRRNAPSRREPGPTRRFSSRRSTSSNR
jgi:D-arabinose 1-dehydrogenase-like Zn-dependent alcohol dehydrogenase